MCMFSQTDYYSTEFRAGFKNDHKKSAVIDERQEFKIQIFGKMTILGYKFLKLNGKSWPKLSRYQKKYRPLGRFRPLELHVSAFDQ